MSGILDETVFDGRESRFRSKPMGLAIGLALFALLLLVGVLFLGSGADAGVASAMENDEPQEEPESTQEAPDEPEAAPEPLPVVTYEVFLDRDPFEPVRTPPEPDPETDEDGIVIQPDPTDPDDPNGVSPTPGDPTDPTDPSDPSAPSAPGNGEAPRNGEPLPDKGCAGDTEERVCNGDVVSLQEITTDSEGRRVATVQVGTELYQVRTNDSFATHYRVRDITTEQVTLSFGDDTFTLRTGDRVLK